MTRDELNEITGHIIDFTYCKPGPSLPISQEMSFIHRAAVLVEVCGYLAYVYNLQRPGCTPLYPTAYLNKDEATDIS